MFNELHGARPPSASSVAWPGPCRLTKGSPALTRMDPYREEIRVITITFHGLGGWLSPERDPARLQCAFLRLAIWTSTPKTLDDTAYSIAWFRHANHYICVCLMLPACHVQGSFPLPWDANLTGAFPDLQRKALSASCSDSATGSAVIADGPWRDGVDSVWCSLEKYQGSLW